VKGLFKSCSLFSSALPQTDLRVWW